MTESKPPATGRIVRQPPGSMSIVAPPTASGHTFLQGNPYQPYIAGRGKANQPVTTTGTAPNLQHPLNMNPATTQFHVQLDLTRTPLTVVTSYPTKPNSGGPPTSRHYPIEKLTTSAESNVKASIKTAAIQKVSYIKQGTSTPGSEKSSNVEQKLTGSNLIQAQIKKSQETGKPVLLGQGLRQPSSQHHFQHKVTQAGLVYSDTSSSAKTVPVNSTPWIAHQHDPNKVAISSSTATTQRAKAPVVMRPLYQIDSNAQQSSIGTILTPHDSVKKHSTLLHQPKTTISISMPALSNIPQSEQGHRNTSINVPPNLTGVKPVYQIMTPAFSPNLPGGVNPVKKLQTMIATQIPNSSTVNTVFTPTNSVLSSGQQITVITCGSGITYVPAPTPPSATNLTSIPIAKVYPQQQPQVSRLTVTTMSNRISVPVVCSAPSTSTSSVGTTKSSSNILHVGTIKNTLATSAVTTTQNSVVSINKSVTTPNTLMGWHVMPHAATSNPAMSNLRQVSTQSNAHLQQAATGSNAAVLQAAGNSAPSPGGIGPTTPTMSPKPAILRRQRPDSSAALKKLSFQSSSSSFTNQRRDIYNTQIKSADRRSAPYHVSRHKNPGTDTKPNEIAVMIQPGSNLSDKNEMKPVLANQVYGKQIVNSNGYAPLKIGGVKSAPGQFPSAGKEGNQSFSVHSVNSLDVKVKLEPGNQNYQPHPHSMKSESAASASQMLQYQNQSGHTYAAESPQSNPVQHRIVSASGQHIKTNTIFANPGSFGQQRTNSGPLNGRGKSTHVIKPAATLQQPVYLSQPGSGQANSHSANSFAHSRHALRLDGNVNDRNSSAFDQIKKEQQPTIKLPSAGNSGLKLPISSYSGPKQPKTAIHLNIDAFQQTNHLLPNPMLMNTNVPQAHPWVHGTNTDPAAGLSPRKRPRKQTHIVTDVTPDVEMMEDEESTDDADECEDEPMPDATARTREISATPVSKLPGNKPSQSPRTVKTESLPTFKKSIKEEKSATTVKSISPTTNEAKPITEFTDNNGVRYVATRKRPAVSVLNRLKPNNRSVANHFMHYTDIKVKDKKVTISDFMNDKKRLTGFNVARLALQLKDMVENEDDIWCRMKGVYEGLVKHKQTLLGDTIFDDALASPTPGTPTSLSNSFNKAISTPGSGRLGSFSGILENGLACSPSTPLDRRTSKVKEEITKIEELAQANLQRCRVVSDQILDTKNMLLKPIDHRPLAHAIFEASTNQKSQSSTSTSNASKRAMKKKANS